MLLIEDILVSDELLNQHFVCDLSQCKGACCVEGDYGAPLSRKEQLHMKEYYDAIAHLLSHRSKQEIALKGYLMEYSEANIVGTPLLSDGSCVYLAKDENGIKRCGFEIAYEQGITNFKKPISCHLYPVRVEENEVTGFKAVNYDVWSICRAACIQGKKLKIPLYQFVKDALIRKFGDDFFNALDGAFLEGNVQE